MSLFAQNSSRLVDSFINFVSKEWALWLPLLVGGLAIFLMLPRPRRYPMWLGAAFGLGALILSVALLFKPAAVSPEIALFIAFSSLALISGALLVTQENPARAALAFTLVILSTCGLFLLLAAPFLMAATIIVYAGAIIVTFLFVVMLAQQHGHSDADSRSREPVLATLTGFLLMGILLYVVRTGYETSRFEILLKGIAAAQGGQDGKEIKSLIQAESNGPQGTLFSRSESLLAELGFFALEQQVTQLDLDWNMLGPDNPDKLDITKAKELLTKLEIVLLTGKDRVGYASTKPGRGIESSEIRRDDKTRVPHLPAENSAHLGKVLFTDFLLPVELGGTLLLVATVGAIAIAQRRSVEERRVRNSMMTLSQPEEVKG